MHSRRTRQIVPTASPLLHVLPLVLAAGGLVLGGAAEGVAGEDLRVVVHAWVQAEADGAADGLGHLALVDGAQAGVDRALDAAVRGHVLGDEGEVLRGGWVGWVSRGYNTRESQEKKKNRQPKERAKGVGGKLTRYMSSGFRPSMSTRSRWRERRRRHLPISAGDRSCGA